ncbi:ankyrin repeat domain-containing 28 [Fusarium albosuccineum]|uniref:Ankyrin repeat domain-containing 28 n=1 Tax=Fusarium albosuccineum TaxID=1237068 RepID=A0A8H4P873_9HYPO|nr:ankyrin repeat domain-containing 28 [Fusarium albosuccineum]
MSITRAALRAKRLDIKQNEIYRKTDDQFQPTVSNHELDWLVFRFGERDIKKDLRLNARDRQMNWLHYSWRFHGLAEVGERIVAYQLNSNVPPRGGRLGAVERLVAYRSRIAEVTASRLDLSDGSAFCPQFEVDSVMVRDTANKLVLAIQSAATNILTTSTTLKEEWTTAKHMSIAAKCCVGCTYFETEIVNGVPQSGWRSDLECTRRSNHTLLHLDRESCEPGSEGNYWKLEKQHDVEAILGLWTWSLKSSPKTSRNEELGLYQERRIVCWNNSPKVMGWRYWAGGYLKKPRENQMPWPDQSWNPFTEWKLGPGPKGHLSGREFHCRLFGWYTGETPPVSPGSQACPIWTLPTSSSLLSLCAHEVFGVVVKSLLEATQGIGQVDIMETAKGPRLRSQLMSDLVDVMVETELASRDEAVSCLLPLMVFEEFSAHRTPLWHAARNGHEVMVTELLAVAQFDRDLPDADGRSPLWQAATNGHHNVVELLLDYGVNPDSSDNTGMAPLASAAAHGHETVVQLLLEKGMADLELQDREGRTALSYAAAHGHELVVELLLEEEANAKILDIYGSNPQSRAVDNWHEGVVRLIRAKDYTADTSPRGDRQINDETKIRRVDWKNPALQSKMEKPIQWKDWVGDGDMTNPQAYGTINTRLALECSPKAEIYVARVLEGRRLDHETIARIPEAIEWAVTQWDVDIIVLPVRISSINKEVKAAIDIAYKKGKVIFTAAESMGFNSRRTFPANSPHVIGVHAVDGRGRDSGISLLPLRGDYNFSALGVAIKQSGPEDDQEGRYASCAGYAAVIAAGAAATILEFARFNLKLDLEAQTWLCSTEGVREMLRSMSTNVDGYNFIAPWTLFGDTSDHEYICDFIMMMVRKRKRASSRVPNPDP